MPGPDFGPLARCYDELRPVDENWLELLDVLVAEGELAGRRVLDVGCGTGRVAAALAARGSRVWGVDPSEEMLRAARTRAGPRVAFRRGAAEALPFRTASFEGAVMRLVVHLVERPAALSELARVLVPGGRAAIATFFPEHFDGFWLNRIFSSLERIDRARFPLPARLEDELLAAGFASVRVRRLDQAGRLTRAEALERIRGRYISTLRLLPEDEFAEGLARAERELGATVAYGLEWAVLVGVR